MPGTNFENDDDDFDAQDVAEVLDEDNYNLREEVNERRTFEELPDVLDVTTAVGDRDDDEALALDADEFDEDAFDDADFEEDDEAHPHAILGGSDDPTGYDEDELPPDTVEGLDTLVADADQVTGGEDDVTDFQSTRLSDEDLEAMGYADKPRGDDRERALDEGLDETFPASDPVSLTRREE